MEVLEIIEEMLSSSSDSSSDDSLNDYWDEIFDNEHQCHRRHIPRVQNFMDNVVAKYCDIEFQEHFRLRRCTFQYVLYLIKGELDCNGGGFGNVPIDREKQLCVALYILGTPDSYRSVSTKFGIGKATAWRSVLKVAIALCKLRNYFITWPTPAEAQATAKRIREKYGFPGVIGVVDGTHIRIAAPKVDKQAYINRKGCHSLQLQVICNDKLEFIHCYAGLQGSVHDMRVFKYSGVQQKCNEEFFPENTHLLGDSAYTLQKYVIVPFRDDGHLTVEEVCFNKVLSSSRTMVERAIGLLKLRWRYFMDKLPMRRTDLIPYYILAVCILHNICLKKEDTFEYPVTIPNEDYDNPEPLDITGALYNEGVNKRNDLLRILNNVE